MLARREEPNNQSRASIESLYPATKNALSLTRTMQQARSLDLFPDRMLLESACPRKCLGAPSQARFLSILNFHRDTPSVLTSTAFPRRSLTK